MKIQIQLTDEIFEDVEKKAEAAGMKPATWLSKRVVETLPLPLGPRSLTIGDEMRRKIEGVLDAPISTVDELVELCTRLSRIQFDGIHLQLTLEEIERLQAQATFMGQTVEDFTETTLRQAVDYLLNLA